MDPIIRTANGDHWTVADEWFAQFLRELQASAGRITRARRESGRGITKQHREAVEYEKQTEQYRRYLHHERLNNAG